MQPLRFYDWLDYKRGRKALIISRFLLSCMVLVLLSPSLPPSYPGTSPYNFMIPVESAIATNELIDPMTHDVFLVTPSTFHDLISKYRNSNAVSMLLHFDSNKPNQKDFIDNIYNKVANDMKGMVRLGAIDCAKWKAFCTDLNPDLEAPRLIIYPPNPLPPIVFQVGTFFLGGSRPKCSRQCVF